MSKRVLVYIDEDAVRDSADLVEAARQMYGSRGVACFGLAAANRFGGAESYASAYAEAYFDYIVRSEGDSVPNYDAAAIARIIESLHSRYAFDAILVPATPFGRIIAPRAAVRLGAGLVADVTEIRAEGDEILLVRPAFSGRLLATVVCRRPGPIMMSVRPRTFSASPQPHKRAEILTVATQALPPSGIQLIGRTERTRLRDIRESAVLVAGGGGAMKDFPLLERLAAALGGMVAASRKAVDHGKAPREIQVGQSGKNVSPKLYIACGISGSAQHMAGLKNAEHIIAVNIDSHAPVCALSDIVVQGDCRSFAEALLERIETEKTNGGLR